MFIRRYISKVVPNALNELWSLMQAKLKVESQIKSSILTEVFPVNVGNLPRLYAYRLMPEEMSPQLEASYPTS